MVVGWPEWAYIVLTHADRFVEALSETCRFGDVRVSCAVYNMQYPGPTPVLRRTTASSTKHTGSKKRRFGLVVSSSRYLCLIRPQQPLSFFIYIHALPTSEQTHLGLNVVPRAKGSPSSVKGLGTAAGTSPVYRRNLGRACLMSHVRCLKDEFRARPSAKASPPCSPIPLDPRLCCGPPVQKEGHE